MKQTKPLFLSSNPTPVSRLSGAFVMSHILTVKLPFGVEPEEALLLLSMKLYEEGKVSLGYAAQMAGYTKRTYMKLLSKHGLPVFNYTVEEFEQELEALEQIQQKLKAQPPSR